MERKDNQPKSLWMLCASMLIFGTVGIFRRYIPLPSAFLALVRGLLGGAVVLLYARIKRGGTRPSGKQFALLALSGAVMGFNWVLLFEAYRHTTVAVATLCYYMAPTIVMLLSPLFFREKLTVKKGVCAAVAFLGMTLVSGVLGGAQGGSFLGVLFGLGAAVLYSAVVILNKFVSGVDAARKTTVQLFAAGLVMLPYLLLTDGFAFAQPSATAIVLLAVLGVVHTGVAYVLYFGSMDGLRAQTVAMFSYIDPVFALVLSALLLAEPIGASEIIGAVLILGAAFAAEYEKP